MKLKILAVEDEPLSVETIRKELVSLGYDWTICNFSEAQAKIAEISPDIIILDLILQTESKGEPKAVGVDLFANYIWKEKFCPVAVYSAQPQELECKHPFVGNVSKGMGSEKELIKVIKNFIPHIELLRKVEENVRQSFALAMRNVAPLAFSATSDSVKQTELIDRSGRRYLAAYMDESVHGCLFCWEQYILPPISKDVLLGDIIMENGMAKDDPASFRVVLTPSCDMVKTHGRTPTQKVLVAQCCNPKHGKQKAPSAFKDKEALVGVLNQGYTQRILFLPAYPDNIPLMVADLKQLDFVSIDNIANDNSKKYMRVASIDSPYRELVAWAYLQVSCRPGLPERDCSLLAQEILRAC